MSTFWEGKYLNAEKSIDFLKATHAEALRGLHDEIETLQKLCSGKKTNKWAFTAIDANIEFAEIRTNFAGIPKASVNFAQISPNSWYKKGEFFRI
jgi:hypothetical protein